ncbi:protein kinase [Nonomuraea sp. NPDC046802]|uniref:serine/threonine protein kinase n=1 Tax=Nonomuraea sp. NPDC046802 TaxID=3154919 RepID=UPI0033FE57F3
MTVITERVRGYRLLERAGQDGPWAVHLARAETSGTEVLVKTLACHRVERRALKRIVRGFGFPDSLAGQPGIIPVLEVGATGDGRPYLVTPLHEGLTLAERPGRSLPMPPDQAVELLRAVAGALAATHAAGGVHGRVTPENVITTGGGVALTGFAMSALMSIVELPDGTLPSVHAAPEELEGRPPLQASDVYALGSMVYELLAGRPAFALDGPGSTGRFVLGVMTEQPPPLPASVPGELADLLSRAMAKDPSARPAATDLTAVERALPLTARLPTAETSGNPNQPPPTARLPVPPPDAEQSVPRELVWTVDPDRSQVRPPFGPQPFSAPAPTAASPDGDGGGAPVVGPRRRSKVPFLIAGASALVLLLGVGSVALAMSGRLGTPAAQEPVAATADAPDTLPQADGRTSSPEDDQRPPSQAAENQPTRQTSSPPPLRRQTTDPATIAAHRPKGLKLVSDNGSTVTIAWRSVRKNGYPTIVQMAPGDRMMSAASGSNTYTVGGLDSATGYCFKVGTVVALGQPSSVAWSGAMCIRGATEANPRQQDDEAQPPIVLPMVTPS